MPSTFCESNHFKAPMNGSRLHPGLRTCVSLRTPMRRYGLDCDAKVRIYGTAENDRTDLMKFLLEQHLGDYKRLDYQKQFFALYCELIEYRERFIKNGWREKVEI